MCTQQTHTNTHTHTQTHTTDDGMLNMFKIAPNSEDDYLCQYGD